MTHEDPFGDLQEWSGVIDLLDRLDKTHKLDHAQPGLIRLIRYRQNWQIRERALKAARAVKNPDPKLVEVIAGVLADENTYADARILAARALADLAPRTTSAAIPGTFDPDSVPAMIEKLLGIPEAPIVHQAMRDALKRIRQHLHAHA